MRRVLAAVLAGAVVLGTSACTAATGAATSVTASSTTGGTTTTADSPLFDSSTVHDIEITVDDSAYDELIAAYQADAEKIWASATVTIDGRTFTDVGIRLKGNSSLRGLTETEAQDPEQLPWLVRLDKYVDGQSYDGLTSFVIRANTTETALNEAVALELRGMAGLATEAASATRLSVNGSDEVLRLIIENPDDAWAEATFGAVGLLYKAEATGDYSYRGGDPDSYTEVFDQEAGEDDLAPLIDFLAFINESDDATFSAELADHLDVDAFATYLAIQEIVGNFDDIDGPGNNSYLHYDEATGLFTVVAWDQNLSFGVQNAGGGMGDMPGGEPPEGMPGGEPPEGMPGGELPEGMPGGNQGGGGMPGGNVLAERFLADDAFAALYTERLAELTDQLIASGAAAEVLATWTAVLEDQASDLVPAGTITDESASIGAYLE
jgi:spore coat protein CotH